jgi:hypothetical protein
MFKNSKKSKFFLTPYSVHVGDFLPHTQYTYNIFYRSILSTHGIIVTTEWNIFYRILSRRGIISKINRLALLGQLSRLGIIFTPYSVHIADFLPYTQYK